MLFAGEEVDSFYFDFDCSLVRGNVRSDSNNLLKRHRKSHRSALSLSKRNDMYLPLCELCTILHMVNHQRILNVEYWQCVCTLKEGGCATPCDECAIKMRSRKMRALLFIVGAQLVRNDGIIMLVIFIL